MNQPTPADLADIEMQLGRKPRDVRAVAFRCACGGPAVVETFPRLTDGTPFPTFYYATCPRLTGAISTLESSGLMGEMNQRLSEDPELANAYAIAHEKYLAARDTLEFVVPEIKNISAGGMPERVKCLHSLIAHSLAAGAGVNPLGDEALAKLPKMVARSTMQPGGVMRVGVIDCGTNSIRLLIADISDGKFDEMHRDMKIVRLGQGVDQTGQFHHEAIERTLAAVDIYSKELQAHRVQTIRFCATSASRDAENRDLFLEGVHERLGIYPEVISGEEEAALSFQGATREMSPDLGPFLVIDIGGGSTEFVFGGEVVEKAKSVNVGCVRMSERHFKSDPPSVAEIFGATVDIRAAIAQAAEIVPIKLAKTLIAVAGTATTVAAAALKLKEYERDTIHLSHISAQEVHEISAMFLSMNRHDRAQLGYMHPGRVDVITAGALVLSQIMIATNATEFIASESDILDGMAWDLASR